MEREAIKSSEGAKLAAAFKGFTDVLLADVTRAMAVPEHVLHGQPRQKNKIIKRVVRDGRLWELHATKGWRKRGRI